MTTTTTVARKRGQTKARVTRIAQPVRTQDGPPEVMSEDRYGTMYVYLDSGQVVVVRDVSGIEMSDRTLRLLRNNRTVAEYLRRDVFYASRELISPPFSC